MNLCLKCKGRKWCGKNCEILKKFSFKTFNLLKNDFEGTSPPSVFISSKDSYPKMNIGILSLNTQKENAWIYDSPNFWSKENIPSNQIIRFRKNLINSRQLSNSFEARNPNRLLSIIQEIGMSNFKTEVELKLSNLNKKIDFDYHHLPSGPYGNIKEAKLISNAKIPKIVEKVYYDSDLKSLEGLKELYKQGLDEHYLAKILSVGVTGLKSKRKFVPTRNSITAIDDNLGKFLLEKIRNYPIIDSYKMYFSGHLGNYYLIILFPEIFSYELFEIVFPKTTWNLENSIEIMTDYEDYYGRKNYAEETAGGYYAARLPILQFLDKIKKQASILAIRFVLPEYDIPLGVWVCRNSVRKSLENLKEIFFSKEEIINNALNLIKNKYNFDISEILSKSKLLTESKQQSRLNKYF